MKNKIFTAAFAFAMLSVVPSTAQSQITNLHEWYDNATGIEGTSIYNGPMYFNQYRTRDASNNPFLGMDLYSKGDVTYDGQNFYNISLKYDINRDVLLVEPINGGNSRSIALISQKTAAFTTLGRKFVNLNYDGATVPNFITGFYEQFVMAPQFTFYIKHHKDVREIINSEILYSDFNSNNEFILFQDGQYHRIKSKKDVITRFPMLKEEINKFYSTTKKTSDTQFMEGLFTYINTLQK